MKSFASIPAIAAAACFFLKSALADVDPIVIKGSKFFYKTNGTQFYIKGVAYQQQYIANSSNSASSTSTNTDYSDPLINADNCRRDIPYLKQLGTNTIRVYQIDPTQSHDDCMNQLADAGIYVIADLSAPGLSIIRDDPAWNDDLYTRYTSVVDVMANYTNTLGFFAGNEVSNNSTNTDASAFVKAAVRDMKSYISDQGYRQLGVGYATNDDAEIRNNLAAYFDCGDRSAAIDFWGYNIYSWCGDSSFTQSGYDVQTDNFRSYDVPVFFAEYGCNLVQPREFTEVEALYGSDMNDVWSGGIVYMYFQEENDYGLVSIGSNGDVSTLADFGYLSSQIANANPTGVQMNSYNPSNTVASSCPTVGADWQAASKLPPTPNRQLCQCMYNALSCVPNNVDEDSYGDLFGFVCGASASNCAGIQKNGTSGTYGAYAMCNPQEQLGFVLNAYYRQQSASGNPSACVFSGSASLRNAASATGSCASLISQAGTAGTGTVTARPSGSSSGSRSSGAGVSVHSQASFFGNFQIAAYILCALFSGVGMILL